ncbi:MAG: cobalamin biosynthesis protein CbiX [Planctomycetes bacterium]|nr:cobalamin biosynthesis protein CbiX [Planctomycetota bacterium]
MFVRPLDPGTAVLLIAHGSRLAAANADLLQLAEQLRSRFPGHVIETAYLELTEPTIPKGAERCVTLGAKRVLLLPYFLSAGTHVTQDLSRFRAQFSEQWPSVRFDLCPPLGLHPLILEIACDRLSEQM